MFQEPDRALFGALMPHLQRAMHLHGRMVGLEGLAAASQSALHRCGYATVLLSESGALVAMNGRARLFLLEADGIGAAQYGLVAILSAETTQLQRLVHQAIATGLGQGTAPARVMGISRPSARRAYQLFIAPLRIHARWPGVAQPAAIVFITDPDDESNGAADLIARLVGFTRAETRLALVLMRGVGLKEAAETLCLSHSTARAQLKKLFDKTQTRRLSELVRLLLRSHAGLQDAEQSAAQ